MITAKLFIIPVEETIPIRTGETGKEAIYRNRNHSASLSFLAASSIWALVSGSSWPAPNRDTIF
jgi:hypothetical protein